MSNVDGGRVRGVRPQPVTNTEAFLSGILDEVEAIHDMLREVLTPKLQPDGDEQPQRVQEPAPAPLPAKPAQRITEQRRAKR